VPETHALYGLDSRGGDEAAEKGCGETSPGIPQPICPLVALPLS